MTSVPRSSMTFEHEGAAYVIEFLRTFRRVRVGVIDDIDIYKDSTYPYTTVILWKVVPGEQPGTPRELVRTGTVGCWHKDKSTFTHANGRLRALRSISLTLDKDLKRKMWAAYESRETGTTTKIYMVCLGDSEPPNPNMPYMNLECFSSQEKGFTFIDQQSDDQKRKMWVQTWTVE